MFKTQDQAVCKHILLDEQGLPEVAISIKVQPAFERACEPLSMHGSCHHCTPVICNLPQRLEIPSKSVCTVPRRFLV